MPSTHVLSNLDTGVFAWTKNYYGPVSGNWCWIENQYQQQRYTLNHGWRFAIFLISLCTYIYVFIYMRRRLRPHDRSRPSSSTADDLDYEKHDTRDRAVLAGCGATPRISLDEMEPRPTCRQENHHRRVSSFSFARTLHLATADDTHTLIAISKPPHTTITPVSTPPTPKPTPDPAIFKILLLNIYPITYLLLWLPGIANRVAESAGCQVRALVVAQCSTQFIGLANAGVYVWREHGGVVGGWWGGGRVGVGS